MHLFRVWCPEDGEEEARDAKEIAEFDAEDAAEQWAEDDDCYSAEYRIVGGKDVVVMVRAVATGELKRMLVSGESVPSYHAVEIKEG